MTLRNYRMTIIAAVCSTAALAAATTSAHAQVVACPKVIAHCASSVGAWCEKENGKVILVYRDKGFAASRFEECLGKVYEQHGKANPYRPPQKPTQNR